MVKTVLFDHRHGHLTSWHVTWQRQDDVTYAKMCLPSLVTDTMRRFLRLESSKKLQGKKRQGVVPLGVRELRPTHIYNVTFCSTQLYYRQNQQNQQNFVMTSKNRNNCPHCRCIGIVCCLFAIRTFWQRTSDPGLSNPNSFLRPFWMEIIHYSNS